MMHLPDKTIPTVHHTANFVWSTSDVLGQGATSYVYKGREKKTGKEFAIKVFNAKIFSDKLAKTRRREFEVLKQLDHDNIIRLYNVEEEQISKQDVIIMELCTAGSLQTFLDKPANMYGLEESELKILLQHLSSGMKHLYDRGIVHRDLKPGNITRTLTEDGSSIYKLTDFGAARILDGDEEFQSLCGTEEYLHPDIYERVILRKPHSKTFTATVDLWSIGVTLYQAATGDLPFRPSGGARRNREMMLRITTEKPTGAISGQQLSDQANIKWSRDLPKSCRLSQDFKRYFASLLAGILERESKLTWTFEQYFSEVDRILSLKTIDVFCVLSASLHKLYITPTKKWAAFQEHVSDLTGVPPSNQLFLLDNAEFKVDFNLAVQAYPNTTSEHPLVLACKSITDFQKVSIPHTCKPPKFKVNVTSENDSSLARICCKTLFDIGKTVGHLMLVQDLIRISVKWFISYFKIRLTKARLTCSEIETKLKCSKMSLEIFEEHYRQETSLLRVISKMVSTPPVVQEMTLFFIEITEKAKYLMKMQNEFDLVNSRVREFEKSIILEEIPLSIFIDEGSHKEDRLKERIATYADKSYQIYKTFKRYKQNRSNALSSDQTQEHLFEKQKLAELCNSSISLLLENSVPSSRKLHKESQTWFTNMSICLSQLEKSENQLKSLFTQADQSAEPIRTMQKIYQEKMSDVENFFYDAAIRKAEEPRGSSSSERTSSDSSDGVQTRKPWQEASETETCWTLLSKTST